VSDLIQKQNLPVFAQQIAQKYQNYYQKQANQQAKKYYVPCSAN
jgi:hypothetical protein